MSLWFVTLASLLVSSSYAETKPDCPTVIRSPNEIIHTSQVIDLETEDLFPEVEVEVPIFQDPGVPFGSLNPVFNIVNTAARAWSVIDANRAVATARHNYANAIPKGAGPFDFEDFSDMQFKSYRLSGKNKLGATVYDLTYTLAHRYNGHIDGKGRFLENVTILPRNIKTLWGYTLDMSVIKANVTNAGTKAQPISAIVLELGVQVATAFKAEQVAKLYEFRGDSAEVKELKIPTAETVSTVESK